MADDRSLAAVLASQGGTRGIAPTRLVAEPMFLSNVQRLFWKNQEREAVAYERTMYHLDPPADSKGLEMLLQFRDAGVPAALLKADNADRVRKVMRTIRYPDVESLEQLGDIEGLTLPQLSGILHFHHPSYPLLSKELVQGLNAIGYPVEYREDVTEDGLDDYAGIMAVLDRLKKYITFENVPESNCFLTRVLEGALVQAARETNEERLRVGRKTAVA